MPVVPFHEVQFPTDISQGCEGGPMYSTRVVETQSGAEQRVQQWSRGRTEWNFPYERDDVAIRAIVKFFRARKGRAYGFRWKDWSDYAVTNEGLVNPSPGTAMQLIKTYSDAGGSEVRNIRKPVAGTVTLRKNGSAFASGGNWTIDTTTGIVTLLAVPGGGDVFDWSGQFDVPVRFSEDKLSFKQESPTMYTIASLSVMELLI